MYAFEVITATKYALVNGYNFFLLHFFSYILISQHIQCVWSRSGSKHASVNAACQYIVYWPCGVNENRRVPRD